MDIIKKISRLEVLSISILISIFSIGVLANDEVILRRVPGLKALPSSYTMQILKASLDASYAEFGPYTLRFSDREMTRSRTFNEMQRGVRVNVADTPITEKWTEEFIRIPIPIQRGILSYRLFLVTKENENLLADVNSLEDLKRIRQGSGNQWSVTKKLQLNDFNIVEGPSKDALMNMLQANRFSIYSRGINEVYGELNRYKKSHPNIVLDKHIALYSYLPMYFHVSPKAERIAKRIERGLLLIEENGEYERIFQSYNEKSLEQAQLQGRKIFTIYDGSETDELWINDLEYLYTTPEMR